MNNERVYILHVIRTPQSPQPTIYLEKAAEHGGGGRVRSTRVVEEWRTTKGMQIQVVGVYL